MDASLGLYLSVPFCRAKCSFCNFASDVFAPGRIAGYVERLCAEVRGARAMAAGMGAGLPERVDSVYFGGGTPSLLEPAHLRSIFSAIRGEFRVDGDAEITMEAAPGQIVNATLDCAMELGVNRVSLGVQSFVDAEAAAVGRLHTGAECEAEISRMRAAGVERVSLDLIAGLPYQTAESWDYSVRKAVESGAQHMSVYLLEVDEDSRLGREALAGGRRYHAGALPNEDETADWYQAACVRLEAAGLGQYEISNFAWPGFASRHNRKYWERKPYVGVGLDAHSMLPVEDGGAVRWANTDDLDQYLAPEPGVSELQILRSKQAGPDVDRVELDAAFEEELFLGLRMNVGVDLVRLGDIYGRWRMERVEGVLADIALAGLVEREQSRVKLTANGRLASNEVFSRLLVA